MKFISFSKKIAILPVIIGAVTLFPMPAFAAIVPECALASGGCQICDIFALLGNVAEFILTVMSSVVVLAIIIGGIYWLVSFGNAERVDRGKQIITAAFIGMAFVLGGYLLVNVTLATLTAAPAGQIVRPFGQTEWSNICPNTTSTPATATP